MKSCWMLLKGRTTGNVCEEGEIRNEGDSDDVAKEIRCGQRNQAMCRQLFFSGEGEEEKPRIACASGGEIVTGQEMCRLWWVS